MTNDQGSDARATQAEIDAADWGTSSLSHGAGCVEVGTLPGGWVLVRNSNDPTTVLKFTRAEWHAFIGAPGRGGVLNDEFDRFGLFGGVKKE